MKTKQITISLNPEWEENKGETFRVVKAYVKDYLSIHKEAGDLYPWIISQIQTGLKMGKAFTRLKDAKALVERLTAKDNWYIEGATLGGKCTGHRRMEELGDIWRESTLALRNHIV